MKLPDNVNAHLAACVNAVALDIKASSDNGSDPRTALLPLALEIIGRDSSVWALFYRLGDRDQHDPDRSRAFAVVGEHLGDPKLIKTVSDWAREQAEESL